MPTLVPLNSLERKMLFGPKKEERGRRVDTGRREVKPGWVGDVKKG